MTRVATGARPRWFMGSKFAIRENISAADFTLDTALQLSNWISVTRRSARVSAAPRQGTGFVVVPPGERTQERAGRVSAHSGDPPLTLITAQIQSGGLIVSKAVLWPGRAAQ